MRRTYLLLLIFLTAGLVFSCSRATNPDIERGSSLHFEDGYPEIRMSALGVLDEEAQGVIQVTADIVYGSLIFREDNEVSRADVDLEIRVHGIEGTTYSETYTTSLQVDSDQESYIASQDILKYERDIRVPPGNYEVVVSVQDQSSGNRTTRTARTFVPDPAAEVVTLTSVQLLGKRIDEEDRGYLPVTTYDVTAETDSIRFVVQVTNTIEERALEITSRLVRFDSDTSPARPMSHSNYSPSSMPYKGIDFRSREVLEVSHRTLEQPGSVMIEYRFPLPERGNYRFEITTEGAAEEELFRARDFGIKSKNYPAIQTAREMAAPLYYLMSRGEYEEMMAIEDPDSLKAAVDRFWLSNIGSVNTARNVISLYYERVEQANKQFSNFKEGWKTDLGMIYILFGPPWYVDRRLNRMQWSYSYDRTDPRYNFFFEKPQVRNEYFPFDNYLLQRDPGYFNREYQQRQLWLTGNILRTRT